MHFSQCVGSFWMLSKSASLFTLWISWVSLAISCWMSQNESHASILSVSNLDRSHKDSYPGFRLDGEGFPSCILREVQRLLAQYECDSCCAKWWHLSPTFPVCFCEFSDAKCFAKSPYTYRHSLSCPEGPCTTQRHHTNHTLTPPSA